MVEQDNEPTAIQVAVLGQYIRDFSFESPNAPDIFKSSPEQPTIDLGVNVQTKNLEENNYEVVLMMKLEAKANDKVAFIAELAYGGLFTLPDAAEEQIKGFLFIEAPKLLFPFARNIIADAVRDGGFPQVLINPIDFAALYEQQKTQMEQPTSGTA